MSTTCRDSKAGTVRVPAAPERVDGLWESVTRTARASCQSAAASPGRATSVTWATEVCRSATRSPDSTRPASTLVSASAAGEPGTVVAARALASAAISARSRAEDRATTTLSMSVPSLCAVCEDGTVGGALTDSAGDDPDERTAEGVAPETTDVLDRMPVVDVGAAPSAHAGLNEASPLASPQTTRQATVSSTAASPQMRARPLPSRRPLPQRSAAGPRPGRLTAPRSFFSHLPVSARTPSLDLRTPGPALDPSLEPTVRVGVRAAARREPAASRAPSGSPMGAACPNWGARAARSRALGRSAGSSARASGRRLFSRRAPLPPCPAHSVRRRARA